MRLFWSRRRSNAAMFLLTLALLERALFNNDDITVFVKPAPEEDDFLPFFVANSISLPVKKDDCHPGEEKELLELIFNQIEQVTDVLMEQNA